MDDLRAEVDWSKERIDADYDARATVGDRFPEEMGRYRAATEVQKAVWLKHGDVEYDAESGKTLDLYAPEGAGPFPVFIFIHGGYWRALGKEDSGMMAGVLAENGIATAVIDYDLAPNVTLTEIVRQVRAATAFLWQNARRLNLDPDRIHVGGSSAGGQLAAMVLAMGWQVDAGLPERPVKSGALFSGLYELAPISRSFAQAWLSLTEDEVSSLSPMRHLPPADIPIAIIWADGEPAGFHRQSRTFAKLAREAGNGQVSETTVTGRNHFNLLMELADPGSEATRLLLGLIGKG